MGPTKKPPHDRFLCPVGNLFIGSSSLRDHRPSANPGIGIEDDCGCGAAETTYLWARLVSGARVDSAGGPLRRNAESSRREKHWFQGESNLYKKKFKAPWMTDR